MSLTNKLQKAKLPALGLAAALSTAACVTPQGAYHVPHSQQTTHSVYALDEAINRCPGRYADQTIVTKRRGEGGPIIDQFVRTEACPTNTVTIPLEGDDRYCVTDRQCYHTTLRNPCQEGEISARDPNNNGWFNCTIPPRVIIQPHGSYAQPRNYPQQHYFHQQRGGFIEYTDIRFKQTTGPQQHHRKPQQQRPHNRWDNNRQQRPHNNRRTPPRQQPPRRHRGR